MWIWKYLKQSIMRVTVTSMTSSSALLLILLCCCLSESFVGGEEAYFSPTGSLLGSEEGGGGGGGPPSSSWGERAAYGNSFTCLTIPQNFSLCRNIGYPNMMVPNLLGHDSLQEADYHAKSWVPLLGLQCHPDTQLFLCSLFSPICLDRPIYPCRSLCQGVQAKCEPRMLAYNYPWPSMLRCDQFPPDHDLCIKPGAANNSERAVDEPACPSCNQAHTCENIVDHFCRADFVFRAKLKRLSRGSSQLEWRRGKWFKPSGREGRRSGGGGGGGSLGSATVAGAGRELTLDHKDHCCASKLRPGAAYIVMGVKRGDQYIATFVMPWNGGDKVLKNAIRTFRSGLDCSNPIPMTIPMSGNTTSSSSGTRRRKRRRGGGGRGGGSGLMTSHGGCRVASSTQTG